MFLDVCVCVGVSASVKLHAPDGPKLTYSPRAVTASKQADDIDEDSITVLSRGYASVCVLCHQSAVLSGHLHQSALSLRLASLLAALPVLMSVHAPGGHSCSCVQRRGCDDGDAAWRFHRARSHRVQAPEGLVSALAPVSLHSCSLHTALQRRCDSQLPASSLFFVADCCVSLPAAQ